MDFDRDKQMSMLLSVARPARASLLRTIKLCMLGVLAWPLAHAETEPADVSAAASAAAAESAAQQGIAAQQSIANNEDAATVVMGSELGAQPEVAAAPAPTAPVDRDLEDVKKSLLKLKRDLVILEEDLLFPASSQVAVYLSMDLGELFQLDAVTLKLNGKEVHHHLYTEKQVDALHRGGVQKLYVGNVKQGANRVTAFFTGRGPSGRDYRRAMTVKFDKGFEPAFIELAISDSDAKYQPEFKASVNN